MSVNDKKHIFSHETYKCPGVESRLFTRKNGVNISHEGYHIEDKGERYYYKGYNEKGTLFYKVL